MTQTIWKTELIIRDNSVLLPEGARPISVGIQNYIPCMWSIVNPEKPKESMEYHVAGTGHPLPPAPGRFLGTFQMMDGELIFHLFVRDTIFLQQADEA